MPNHYETHLTLSNSDPDILDLARRWTEAQGLKWTQIVLESGKTPLQPMITLWSSESVTKLRNRIEEVVYAIGQLGGAVVRIKIEADAQNDDVPQGAKDVTLSQTNYFEHHVKVLLTDATELAALRILAEKHQGRLSKNARRQRTDGSFERFVTQRVYGYGKAEAAEQLERLLNDFRQHEVVILEVEAEYVLYDSNIAIDSDWF